MKERIKKLEEILEAVKQLRMMQKQYFRQKDNLVECMKKEAQVDHLLTTYLPREEITVNTNTLWD